MSRTLLAVDIGGTFTDVVLEAGGTRHTAKVLTDVEAPERGMMAGIRLALSRGGIAPGELDLIVHGTTLATNAILERKGARTALLTTEGFRDTIEIGYENRFDQYDLFIERARPLVPRALRFGVPERLDAKGRVHLPLDEAALEAIAAELAARGVESVAIGFLHSYADPRHEQRAAGILARRLPGAFITLSSQVSPEMREYERFSTACANAYVQPQMARYLGGLREALAAEGFACPLLLMTSGGGLTDIDTAIRFPIRLVESGPAGGAILAADIATRHGLPRILSFDMGGTTAKVCLIDDGAPHAERSFEVDRQYRFMKGSGLPLRIPVVEMVEIGAGGGSLGAVDAMRRVTVGPESAGSRPGPACYGLGGERPAVSDANLLLGRIDPAGLSGGEVPLYPDLARAALLRDVGVPLGLDAPMAAQGMVDTVEEAMANAARMHAVERGLTLTDRVLVAFGGSAPLHAARLARKLAMRGVVIPSGAGVGSAIGFLRAPIAFEVARTRIVPLATLDTAALDAMFDAMAEEATAVVRRAAGDAPIGIQRGAQMRYVGQGHEIAVALPPGPLDAGALGAAFEESYCALFGRLIPDQAIEATGWSLRAATAPAKAPRLSQPSAAAAPVPDGRRALYDPATGQAKEVPVYRRPALRPGMALDGPAIVAEAETSTVVLEGFRLDVWPDGALFLADTRWEAP